MLLEKLRDIGLTNGELSVYEALLNLGETTKTKLLKESKVCSSSLYIIIDKLVEKGLVSKVDKDGVAHFSPATPNNLLRFIEKKEREIKKEKDIVVDILPLLNSKFNKVPELRNVEVFNGWDGMDHVFTSMIEESADGENFIFGAGSGENAKQANIFFNKFYLLRKEMKVHTKIIFNEEVRTNKIRVGYFLNSVNNEARFLKQTTPSEVHLYKNKVLLIILSKNPLIIRLSSKEIFSSFKQYFDILWMQAKK